MKWDTKRRVSSDWTAKGGFRKGEVNAEIGRVRKSSLFLKNILEREINPAEAGLMLIINVGYSKFIKKTREGRRISLKLGMKLEFCMSKIATESCRPQQEI